MADAASNDGHVGSFASYDGTKIGYRTVGDGTALVCLPGGPGRTCEYLGDLGGLSGSRQLIMPDTRGTGLSETPADPASYRCDRLVEDVESLRGHLRLERMDLLAHSAACTVAILYAASYPQRVGRLTLLTPALVALGIEVPEATWNAAIERRSGEPWYAEARAALDRADAGDTSIENRRAYMPLLYGRWDDAARAQVQAGFSERARPVLANFYAAGAFDADETREAVRRLAAPVLIYAGELDPLAPPVVAESAAKIFPNATLTVQPAAGHFPWLDDPALFTRALASFLS